MKNKITLMFISLFLLCFSVKAGAPALPKVTADPTAFSLFEGEKENVLIHLKPTSGYTLDKLKFEIKGDITTVKVTEGELDNNNTKNLLLKV